MQQISELSLPFLDLEANEFAKDPVARFKTAWNQHPWLARARVGYVVTQHDAIVELMAMENKLRIPHEAIIDLMNARGSRWERFQRGSLLAMSGDTHKRIRDVVAPAFTPRAANTHRTLMREVISRQLDEWVPKGAFDFVEFASYFPITVMCGQIGASPAVIPKLRVSLEALGMSFSLIPGLLPRLEEAVEVLEAFVAELVANRRNGERLSEDTDLLDALIAAHDGGGLSAAEMNNLLVVLFAGGFDSSKNMLTLIIHELLTRPEIYARCAEDRAYCQKVVEEGLRFHSPGTVLRVATGDLNYRDVLIPKDTVLRLNINLAGRHPASGSNPDIFDPERVQQTRHLAFGRGMRMCLGQFIARAQNEEGLHLIAQRIGNPRLAGEINYRPYPKGLSTLPITFTPKRQRTGTMATTS